MSNPLDQEGFPSPQDDFGDNNPFVSPVAEEAKGYGYVTQTGEPLNPWTAIWTKPRVVVRQALETDPERHVLLIMALSGMGNAVGNNPEAFREMPNPAVVLGAMFFAAVIGAVFSILFLYIGAWILAGVGRLLGGVGRSLELRTAIAYANIISVWGLPLSLAMALVMWMTADQADPSGLMIPLLFIGLAMIVIGVWQFVTLCRTVGEAHQFSGWKGLLTIILPGVILAVTLFVVIGLFVLGTRS